MSWLWWVGAALALGVVQMLVVDLIFLMLAGGALAAALVGGLGGPFWAQGIAFAVVSGLLVILLRPIAMDRLQGDDDATTQTNVKALVGRSAEVIIDVTTRSGRVKLAGEVWSARTEATPNVLTSGTLVRVVRIDGATAVVEPVTVPLP